MGFFMLKLCIFDLDGTTFDTQPDLMNAMNGAIEKYGYPPCSVEAFRDAVSGGFQQTLRKLLPKDFDREDIFPDICETFRSSYAEHYMDNTYPYEGVEEALRTLRGMGIRLAVFSNKIHERTVDICNRLLPDIKFDYILGARDGQPLKPDPAMALYICRTLGAAPSETLFIGDSDVDVETAKNAGIRCIGCSWGYWDKSVLEQAGADVIIDRPDQLVPSIKKLGGYDDGV